VSMNVTGESEHAQHSFFFFSSGVGGEALEMEVRASHVLPHPQWMDGRSTT
jgi:hypothetical protein